MTAKDVFILRKQGRIEEAYTIIRQLYSVDKSYYNSVAMFWTAFDVLKVRLCESRLDEAEKIFEALKRLYSRFNVQNDKYDSVLSKCADLISKEKLRETSLNNAPAHIQFGAWGEELAIAYLREKGYVILERDWRSRHRDIDIIARDGEVTVFIEVKARRNADYGNPILAVDRKKQWNILLSMNHYINYRRIGGLFRFDVITITGSLNSNPIIEHIENFIIPPFHLRPR